MIYGYLRVSSDKQDVNNQKQGVLEFAEKKGWHIDDYITDDGVSGTKEPEKRQLGILMQKCKAGDIIVCSELSRLGRKMLMVMSILEYCMKNEITVYTVKDNYVLGDNIQSSVLAFAFSLASQIERDMIAMRTKESLSVKRQLGVMLGSPRREKSVKHISQSQLEEIVGLIDEGKSICSIAKRIGVNRATIVHHLIKNGLYKGQLCGVSITYCSGKEILINSKNCGNYGLSYGYIKAAAAANKDLSEFGIEKIEKIFKIPSLKKDNSFKISDNENIDRGFVLQCVMQKMTIPEIHASMNNIDYDVLYDYIKDDTEISMLYREKGHLRVKTIKK